MQVHLDGRSHSGTGKAGSTLPREFQQIVWDDRLRAAWEGLLRLAVAEDLGEAGDWTTRALVPEDALGRAAVVARESGVIAGLPGVECALRQIDPRLRWLPAREDGQSVRARERIGRIEGPARGLLAAERLVLNLLGRLSGIATLTRRYVEAVRGTKARIYDTRKTTPGWRRLEKYAVGQGGGWNHRTGLFDAVLIKDNHLALWSQLPADATLRHTAAEAVAYARQMLREHAPERGCGGMIVEVEVDRLQQFEEVLSAGPDIVLLDNMSPAELRQAVVRRDAFDTAIELEASGKVDLGTVREIAETGVERISVGALTHSAEHLDVGLDWIGDDVARS
jgi:nicotinate-nucleotide pyrophosphorylase (carboxylating)